MTTSLNIRTAVSFAVDSHMSAMVKTRRPVRLILKQCSDQQNTVCTLGSGVVAWHHNAVNSTRKSACDGRDGGSFSEFRALLFDLNLLVVVFLTLGNALAQEPSPPSSSPPHSQESEAASSATATEEKRPATKAPATTKVTKEEARQTLYTACTEEKTPDRAAAIRALGLIPNE